MLNFLILTTSGLVTFFAHDWAESFLLSKRKKPLRLIVKGRQFHHSFFGVITILCAVFFLSGVWAIIFYGYGLGNIWQHKITHNRVNESGMVFISKIFKL